MTAGLTARQAACLRFIEAEIDAGRPSPSYQQIADHLGMKSKSGVNRLIGRLEARGHITRIRRFGRSIALVRTKCPRCGYLIDGSRQTNSPSAAHAGHGDPGSGRGDSLTASGQTTGGIGQ